LGSLSPASRSFLNKVLFHDFNFKKIFQIKRKGEDYCRSYSNCLCDENNDKWEIPRTSNSEIWKLRLKEKIVALGFRKALILLALFFLIP